MLTSKYLLGVIALSTVIGLMSYLTSLCARRQNNNFSAMNSSFVSSVWCNYGQSGEKICRFQNLCYSSRFQEFQFILTDESVVSGVQNVSEWMNIDMSTVLEHNAFKLKLSILSDTNKFKRLVYHKLPTFILHRFKPDNIMHVIHDDLIPLYTTMEAISDGTVPFNQKFGLAFSDNYSTTALDEWYQNFSAAPLIRLMSTNETVCFSNAYIGLHRTTVWFRYGFKQVQGPYYNNNFNSQVIRNFVNFNLEIRRETFHSDCKMNSKQIKIIVLSRSQTRRILNMEFLVKAIKKACTKIYPNNKFDIVQIDISIHSINFILCQIRQAKLIVGMHGAAMILSIFLPSLSGIVELFPFGINPENVSFLKSLLEQHQQYPLYYEPWINIERENSVAGMNTNPLLGGISHLPQHEQNTIKGLTQVPAVKCCHDPTYLYYMYHDTFLSDSIFEVIHKCLRKTQINTFDKNVLLSKLVFPASPAFLMCVVKENILSVDWGELSNAQENVGLWFQITVQFGEHVKNFNIYDSASTMFATHIDNYAEATEVWLQAFNNKNIGGIIKHTRCLSVTE